MTGISLGNYFQIRGYIDKIQLNIEVINIFSDEMSASQEIMSVIRELYLLNMEIR